MSARYLVRFDDICPTMNWYAWERIERVLTTFDIKPILAVVPDNKDPELEISEPYPAFWNRVREWQQKGYLIGLHGYQHLFTTSSSGVIGLNARSEFSGLPIEEQQTKLRDALRIFHDEQVRPSLFVAPAHSFDRNTIQALKTVGITAVSDGFFPFPRKDQRGVSWLPQQFWHFRPMPFGVWTVCLHCNRWNESDLTRFERTIEEYAPWIADPNQVLRELEHAPRTWTARIFPEYLYAPFYRWMFQIKQRLQGRSSHS